MLYQTVLAYGTVRESQGVETPYQALTGELDQDFPARGKISPTYLTEEVSRILHSNRSNLLSRCSELLVVSSSGRAVRPLRSAILLR